MRGVKGNIETHVMTATMTVVAMFALWTCGLQVASFAGIAWSMLLYASAWLLAPSAIFVWLLSRRIAAGYVAELPMSMPLVKRSALSVWAIGIVAMLAAGVIDSYSARFAILVVAIACIFAFSYFSLANSAEMGGRNVVGQPALSQRPPDWLAWLVLAAVAASLAGVVVFANRSDFDDAEYIQLALQTLRHPDRAPNSFDASLGFVLEYFRFAPYRPVSYETFVGLIAYWTGRDLLDIYYLAVPGAAAVLSALIAFLFLRWLLPLSWTLVALVLFAVLSLAWGDTHFAYGNRLFVRMFQGKALLIAITTPAAVLLGMLLVRRPSFAVWAGLLAVQVVAVGVSSSGIVTTLFATAIGLGVGFLLTPSRAGLLAAAAGGTTLIYPLGFALWLKRVNTQAADITSLGTVSDIGSSLGGGWRQGIVVAVLLMAVWLTSAVNRGATKAGRDAAEQSMSIRFALLVAASVLLVLNPAIASLAAAFTAKNMSWRLGWAAPMPLVVAAAFAVLLASAFRQPTASARYLYGILPLALLTAFLMQMPIAASGSARWTLAGGNGTSWGFAQHKVPPEYGQALALADTIKRAGEGRHRPITVLVEPRIGTWLTVAAPDLRLIMPGHGYPYAFWTVMDQADLAPRMQLLQQVAKAPDDMAGLEGLLDAYKVDVIVSKQSGGSGQPNFVLNWRNSRDSNLAPPATPSVPAQK